MNMMKRRRDLPVPEAELPVSFETFHTRTRALFRPCDPPPREPDFISPGRSVYWDIGTGVVRASDHWSDQNGCGEIGGCVWAFKGFCRPDTWEIGFCPYWDFRRRVRVIPTRPATAEDLALARLLREGGGGIDPKLFAGPRTPDWARIAPRGTLAALPAREAMHANPELARVLTADERVIRRILEAGEVPLPARIS